MMVQYALILGIALLLAGIMGFIEPLAPNDELLGIFAVDPAHNIFHILFGLYGIWAGLSHDWGKARGFTWFTLIVYGLLALLGFILVPTEGMLFGLIHMNAADHILHLVLALSALAVLIAARGRHGYPV